MSLPTRRPAPGARVALVLLPLLALVVGLLAGPASTGGAQAAPVTASSATGEDEAAVLETLGWLQRRVSDRHLVAAPDRHVRVKVVTVEKVVKKTGKKAGKKHRTVVRRVKRVHWVKRSRPGAPYPGLTVDVATALRRLDPDGGLQARMARALQPMASDYTGYHFGFWRGRYAGATAALVHLAAVSGLRLGTYADGTLRRSLAGMVHKRRGDPQRGRVSDSGAGGDTSNTLSQAAAVQALAAVDSDYLRVAARFLAKQDCPSGGFRLSVDSPDFTCRGSADQLNRISSVDATASAVLALKVARAHGVRHLDDELAAASAWLARQVRRNGGVGAGRLANAQSTALTALALRATGRTGLAGNAAAWLRQMQVDQPMIRHHRALRGQRGAIAWNRRVLVRAQQVGHHPRCPQGLAALDRCRGAGDLRPPAGAPTLASAPPLVEGTSSSGSAVSAGASGTPSSATGGSWPWGAPTVTGVPAWRSARCATTPAWLVRGDRAVRWGATTVSR